MKYINITFELDKSVIPKYSFHGINKDVSVNAVNVVMQYMQAEFGYQVQQDDIEILSKTEPKFIIKNIPQNVAVRVLSSPSVFYINGQEQDDRQSLGDFNIHKQKELVNEKYNVLFVIQNGTNILDKYTDEAQQTIKNILKQKFNIQPKIQTIIIQDRIRDIVIRAYNVPQDIAKQILKNKKIFYITDKLSKKPIYYKITILPPKNNSSLQEQGWGISGLPKTDPKKRIW